MAENKNPPLTLHRFHILTALADGDLHGSGIARDVEEQTGGDVRLWPATLYGSLDVMADEGLINELTGRKHPEGSSERRRYYRITPAGRAALRRHAERLSAVAHTALDRLRGT